MTLEHFETDGRTYYKRDGILLTGPFDASRTAMQHLDYTPDYSLCYLGVAHSIASHHKSIGRFAVLSHINDMEPERPLEVCM